MAGPVELLAYGIAIGVGGSACIDLWSLILRRGFRVPTLDYAFLGRWLGHMRQGQFFHERIGHSPAVAHERSIGWVAHYGIGIGFAFVLLATWGTDWARSPTILPPMFVGIASVAAPWFVMQPAFGLGVAGAKSPNPWPGRLRNLGTHTAYGLGLFLTAFVIARF